MTEIFHTMEQRHNEYYAKGVEVARVRILQHFNFSGNFMTYMSSFQSIFISLQFMQSIFPKKPAHKSSPQKRKCVIKCRYMA